MNVEDAKEFRLNVRSALKDQQNGWGYMFYGNCGVQKYIPCLQEYKNSRYDDLEKVDHTNSEELEVSERIY